MNAPAYPFEVRQREAAMVICPDPLPCPFCGSTELLASEILDCTEGAEEDIPTWCCGECDAEAPARVWNNAVRQDGPEAQALHSLRKWAAAGFGMAIDWHRRWRVPLPADTTTTDALEGTD